MNQTVTTSGVWARGQFLGVAAVFLVAQAALLMAFADRSNRVHSPAPLRTHFLALAGPLGEDNLMRTVFAGNPAIFAWPGDHGFSGRAWLSQRPAHYRPSYQLEAPAWLGLDHSHLGIISPSENVSGDDPLFLDSTGQDARPLEPSPPFLPAAVMQTPSIFRLRGGLLRRWDGQPPQLTPQPSAQLLTNSIVEIAIDASGNVLAHRLVARSGSAAADDHAVALARGLRFLPSAGAATTWGQAVFDWDTIEATNAEAMKE